MPPLPSVWKNESKFQDTAFFLVNNQIWIWILGPHMTRKTDFLTLLGCTNFMVHLVCALMSISLVTSPAGPEMVGKLSIGYSENRANRTITLLLFCKGSISAQLLSANSNGATLFLNSILILLHFKRESWKKVLVSTSKYSRLISFSVNKKSC